MQYTSHTRNSLLLKTILILVFFGFLYSSSAQSTDTVIQETVYIKDVFSITEADRYAGTENTAEISFDQWVGNYTIDKGGRYFLTGDLSGTLYIDAEDQHVHLILNNVSITGINGPAISVLSAGKVFITSLDDTVNSLGDSAVYST